MEMLLGAHRKLEKKKYYSNIMQVPFCHKNNYLLSLLVDAEYSDDNLPIKYKFSGVVTGILTSLISSSSALSQELELAQAQL